MERLLSTMIGSSVVARASGEHLGTVEAVVLDPRDGVVVAFRVRRGFIFAHKFLLLPRDIGTWDGDRVMVQGSASFVKQDDVPLLPQRLRSAFPWVGLRVETEAGRSMGRVDDVSIHLPLFQARRLEVTRSLFGVVPDGSSIIAMDRVATVTRRAIIVLEDGSEPAHAGLLRAGAFRSREASMPGID